MVIGLGVERLSGLMSAEIATYPQGTLEPMSPVELEIFDEAIPKLLNRHYKARVSGAIYQMFAGDYLSGCMRAKRLLGSVYAGNDADAGLVSKELCFNMFYDEQSTPDEKTKWETYALVTAAGWKPLIGYTTSAPSTISNDDFGSMVISHVVSLDKTPNLLEIRYHIDGSPMIPQYVEPAFKLNETQLYQFDKPIMVTKNTKLFVEGNVAVANFPTTIMQGGICFANANWLNTQIPTLA
jgi:hypothetical protein